jgi:hypothetical protein
MTIDGTLRVTILSWTMKFLWTMAMDNSHRPYQSRIDEKVLHQVEGDGDVDHQRESDEKVRHQSSAGLELLVDDGNCQSKSTITRKLCKQVLAYIKW